MSLARYLISIGCGLYFDVTFLETIYCTGTVHRSMLVPTRPQHQLGMYVVVANPAGIQEMTTLSCEISA